VRVLRFLPSAVYGGPHNEVAELHERFLDRGVSQVAVVPHEPGDASVRLRRRGVDVRVTATWRPRRTRSLRFWFAAPFHVARDVWTVGRLVRAESIDVVVGSGGALQIAVGARLSGARVVWIVADTSLPTVARVLLMPLLRVLANAVLVAGESLLRYYPGARIVRARTVLYFPPVDLSRFRAMAHVPVRQPVVGTVGHLNPDKGIDILIAAASLAARHADVRFLIVATEQSTHWRFAALVRDAIDREGPTLNISLCPAVTNVEKTLREFDVFVCSSRREGAPTAVIEAQACGLPVVAANVGAMAELIEDGVTGFLVPPEDPVRIAEAVVRLVLDGELRKRQAQASAARARRLFGVEATVASFLAAFETAGACV
jgi:glycosyltransferase involved in cell wall biosynthesis